MTAALDEYTLNDLDSDMRHLSDAIDILADITFERDDRMYPGKADSLLWLIREEANRLVVRVENMFPVHRKTGGQHNG
jgi:hypothetical protein